MNPKRTNHLANETSPYLLQHAGNPVDWYVWGDEALERARTEDKPLLLSIGYSACHWCHVMAHESFENEETARIMNEHFINIKVDREERPDLDTVYMEAVQSMTGRGGWPLTVFLTPAGHPFFGGTYFPPQDRYGLPGFPSVLMAVADYYKNHRSEVDRSTRQVLAALEGQGNRPTVAGSLTSDDLDKAYRAIKAGFDRENGGFGEAPKFPQPVLLEFLIGYHLYTREKQALEMVESTLEAMAKGGIFDQIGGGFHRYATDRHWLVPHFEKMLYDNALLSRVYLHTYQVNGSPLFRRIAEETLDYLLREMTSPQGGFYSSQDADSEGQEGDFYLWSLDEILQTLGDETGRIIAKYFGVTADGHFEGRNILHRTDQARGEEPDLVQQARSVLLEKRNKRVKPGRDEKILAAWNGLALSSLAQAATVLHRRDYLDAAIANGIYLVEHLAVEGILLHNRYDQQVGADGFLDDYAWVIEALLDLHQATFEGRWLKEALRLANTLVDLFWDEAAGMFYDTSTRHPPLFMRPNNIHDGAVPAGPSSAARVLLKISRLTGDGRYEEIAQKSLQQIGGNLTRQPMAFGNWLCALNMLLSASQEIAIIGPRHHPDTEALLDVLLANWNPNRVMACLDPADPAPCADIPLIKNRKMLDQRPTVYLCERQTCQMPVNDPDSLNERLA